MQKIFDIMPVLIFVRDGNGTYLMVNQAYADHFKRTKKSIEGKTIFDTHDKESAEEYIREDKKIIRTGVPIRNIIQPYRRKGRSMWFRIDKYPYIGNDGKAKAVIGFCTDITEQKNTEEELFKKNQQFIALLHSIPVGVSYSEDVNSEIVRANPALLQQLELNPGDNISASTSHKLAPGKRIRYYIDGKEISAKELPMQKAVKQKKDIGPIEIEAVLPSGKRWIMEASGAPIRNSKGKVIGSVAVNVDITERKKLELLKEEQALIEMQRVKSDFIADATHELRTPLAIIRGNLDMILMGKSPRENALQTLEVIDREIAHMTRLMSDLSMLTGKNTEFHRKMIKEKIDLSALIQKVVIRTRAIAYKKKIDIRFNIKPKVMVCGDGYYLEKLFLNIINNATYYGRIKGKTQVNLDTIKDHAIVTVKDNGIGIAEEDLPHIFKRFYRADKARTRAEGRTGLGLAIASWIAEAHGGEITVTSKVGIGSKFTIIIPLLNNKKAPLNKAFSFIPLSK